MITLDSIWPRFERFVLDGPVNENLWIASLRLWPWFLATLLSMIIAPVRQMILELHNVTTHRKQSHTNTEGQ
jgi:hypothetical protein